jgi:predicted transposase YdaD
MKDKRKHQREKREYKQKREYKHKKELKRFDLILKEIFSKAVGIIFWLSTGQKIDGKARVLPTEIRFVKSFYPDILLEIGGKIIHIEIQVQQDKTLPERMLDYFYTIRKKYGKTPTQIVLFVGKGNPPPSKFEIKDEFQMQNLSFNFVVLDMKKIDPDEFIKSDKPEEVIVGILAGKFKDKPKIIKKVKERIVEIVKNEEEIAKYIDSISFLAGLFDIEIKVKPMPIEVDIRKTFLYKWGREEGIKEGIKEGERRGIVKGLKEGEQRGIIKGKREGLKEAILLGVQIKFGRSKIKELKTLLEKVDDVNYLKKIKRKIIEAKTWDDFLKSFKTTNSKNKNSKGK